MQLVAQKRPVLERDLLERIVRVGVKDKAQTIERLDVMVAWSREQKQDQDQDQDQELEQDQEQNHHQVIDSNTFAPQ